MKEKWKVGLVTGAAALMTVSLVGCGSGSGNNTSSTSGSGSSSTNTTNTSNTTNTTNTTNSTNTTQTTSTSSSSAPKQGKPLVIMPSPYGSFQDNFNPFSPTANAGTNGLIYEPLFYYSLVGSDVYPILGTKMTWSNGNKTLTVDLNSKATWSDGQPFTSDDVVFTFNDLLKKYPAVDTNGVWKELSDVKANGPNQVVFDFKKADVPFAMYVLQTDIMPKHIWSSLGDPSKAKITKPIGTGPYTLSSFTAQDYKFKARDDYYKGTPPVPELDFPAFSSNDSADLALAKGQIDWGGVMISNIDQNFVAKNPHNHYWFPPNNIVGILPNLTDPLLKDPAVRKAISLAVNRDDISKKGEYGYEQPAQPDGIFPNWQKDWADPNLPAADQKFTYDPSQAEKTLQAAGYTKGSDGIYQKNGKKLSFTLIVVSGWTDWDADAQLISQELKKVGIQINVKQEQYAAYQSQLSAHNFQMAVGSTGGGPSPYFIFNSTLGTKKSANYEQFSDPAVDAALADFASTSDQTKQKQDIYKVEKALAEKLPIIPLVYGATWYEYNDSKYTGWPTAKNPYVSPAPWSWPAPEIVLMHLKPVS